MVACRVAARLAAGKEAFSRTHTIDPSPKCSETLSQNKSPEFENGFLAGTRVAIVGNLTPVPQATT
jgi:hypothetical protein